MKRFSLVAIAFGTLALIGLSPMSSPATAGVGAHGYDFLIGSWSCINAVPSALEGPSHTSVTIARSVNGTLSIHVTATNFDATGYLIYDAKSKTWWNPSIEANGGYGTESTQQTGTKTTWAGPFVDPSSGKTAQVRDLYQWVTNSKYTDLYQISAGGAWKTVGNSTCTRM